MTYQDYIIRQIALFARVLQRILGLARDRRDEEALDAVEAALQALAAGGLDTAGDKSQMLPQPFSSMTTTFEGREIDLMTARLFKEAGAIHAQRGEANESYASYVRALNLMLSIQLGVYDMALPDYAPTIDDLRDALSDYVLPDSTSEMLIRYYEQTGAYAKAEDVLYDFLDATEDRERATDIGIAFYERLLDLGDDRLAAGDLPRDEVQAGLEELRQLT
jgi:tetratricopeptide (TPR) repeat protein